MPKIGNWHTGLLLIICACSAPVSEPQETAVAPLSPLLRSDRTLRFRGRSTLESSRPRRPRQPMVGYLLSTLRLAETPAHDHMSVHLESLLYDAESELLATLSTPRERREQRLRIQTPAFEIAADQATTAWHRGAGEYGPAQQLAFTDDGFGLNAAARRMVNLVSLALPASLYDALAAGQEVNKEVSFYLVRQQPQAERQVIEAAGLEPPPGTERQVQGFSVLRPVGREPYPVDWRQPGSGRDQGTPGAAEEETRVQLPALRISVEVRLTIRRFFPVPGDTDITRRHDRLTLTVLADRAEPWILAREGVVRIDSGTAAEPIWRESFMSRALYRIDDGSLDAVPGAP